MSVIISFLASYLSGSILWAVLVSKLLSLPDPREVGSKNPGVTNVLRISGKFPAILTLLGDVLKGTVPVIVVGTVTDNSIAVMFSAIGTVIGHMYPVFFKFKGGKAVATSVGAYLGLGFPIFAGVVAVWLVCLLVVRISSIASLSAMLSAPIFAYLFDFESTIIAGCAFIFLLILYRHKDNLNRLRSGRESRVRF